MKKEWNFIFKDRFWTYNIQFGPLAVKFTGEIGGSFNTVSVVFPGIQITVRPG